MKERGTYALIIFMERPSRLRIGRLGFRDFPAGYYVYIGSALGGLQGRLKHHLKPDKRLHWHIDYLLQQANPLKVWYTPGEDRLECTWNGIVAALPGAQFPVRGFGSSDCRCPTHLTFFPGEPPFDIFQQMRKQRGLPQVKCVLARAIKISYD